MKKILLILLLTLTITIQAHAQLKDNPGYDVAFDELQRQIDIAVSTGIILDSPAMCRLIYDFKNLVNVKEQSISFDAPGNTLRFCYNNKYGRFMVDQYFYRITNRTLEVGNEENNTWDKWGVFNEDYSMLILTTGKIYSLMQYTRNTKWGKYND